MLNNQQTKQTVIGLKSNNFPSAKVQCFIASAHDGEIAQTKIKKN